MALEKKEVTAWMRGVGDWVGDSPKKAATFAVVVFVIGFVMGYAFGSP